MRKGLLEKLKTVCIVMLVITGVFLLANIEITPGAETDTYLRAERDSIDYLGICGVAIYNGVDRSGGAYLGENLRAGLDAGREVLSRAMQTASVPEHCTDTEWRLGLAFRGVLVDLFGCVPAEVVWDAFGCSDCPTTQEIGTFVLSVAEDGKSTRLLFVDGDGQYWRCDTGVSPDVVEALAAERSAQVRLAAELGSPYTDVLEPEKLLSDEIGIHAMTVAPAYSFAPDDFSSLAALQNAFGINPYTDASYTDGSGNRVYQGAFGTLVISEEGHVRFLADEQGPEIFSGNGKPVTVQAVEGVLALLDRAAGGENEAYYYLDRLEAVSEDEDSLIHLKLGRAVGGIPIWRQGSAAGGSMTVRNGHLVEAEFDLSRFRSQENVFDGVLTGRQAYGAYCMQKDLSHQLLLVLEEDQNTAKPAWILY